LTLSDSVAQSIRIRFSVHIAGRTAPSDCRTLRINLLARLIEFDPAYCDTVVSRFERVTGKQVTQAVSGTSFEEIAQERAALPPAAEEPGG
jgi:hypothetical protein